MKKIEIDFSLSLAKKTKAPLNKPFRLPSGSKKKFGVYVKNDKGNIVKVTFGDPNMSIKRDNPERRKSFRARHGCDNPGPKYKANYWSCKMWSVKPVSKITGSEEEITLEAEVQAKGKGLWYNIQQKKKRMGKNYRPAKKGSSDYPDKKAYEKAQAAIELTYTEAEKKTLNKPFRLPSGSNKKFGVYVKNPKGNVVVVKFGDPNMEIKRDDPDNRKSFRARHQCDTNPGPKWKARYWSCRMWEGGKSVTEVTKGSVEDQIHDQEELLKLNTALASVESVESDIEDMKYLHEEYMEMSEQTLLSIADKAKALIEAMNKDPEIAMDFAEPFIAAKLALMDDYMNTVYNYIMYQKSGEEKDKD